MASKEDAIAEIAAAVERGERAFLMTTGRAGGGPPQEHSILPLNTQ